MDIAQSSYTVHVIDEPTTRAASVTPIILFELENLMFAQDCITELIPEFMDPPSVKTALSMPNTLAFANYERLEILGDR